MRRAIRHPYCVALALALASFYSLGNPARAGSKADVTLRYSRGDGAERCPDEAALREAVLVHLGYDPFAPEGARVVVVAITKQGRGLTARIDRLDERDAVVGTRSVESASTGCKELAASVALAVSIAIDPLHGVPGSRPPPPIAVIRWRM